MLFDSLKKEETEQQFMDQKESYEYKNKYGFIDELKSAVRTDEEYARYRGFID